MVSEHEQVGAIFAAHGLAPPAPGGLGEGCASNGDCKSWCCDRGFNTANTNRCMPRGGTGAANDPCGDSDVDAIPESIEARLSNTFKGIFDPRPGSPRDIDLIVGSTDPAFALSTAAREELRSRFRLNGFELHLDDGALNGVNGAGGVMGLAGTTATATGDTTPAEALAVRDANVGPLRRATAHFILLAGTAATKDAAGATTSRAFGFTIPGAMVMRTGFIGINDIAWYQAGVLMHELGHGLGLCHPISQDGATTSAGGGNSCGLICGAIPVVQRDNGGSVMGAPADDPNFVAAAINVLRRPLDYASAQWPLIVPGCSFVP